MKRAPGMPRGRGQGPGTTSANPGLRCTCPRTPRVGKGRQPTHGRPGWRAPGHESESCGNKVSVMRPCRPPSRPPLRCTGPGGERAPTPRPRAAQWALEARGTPPRTRHHPGPLAPRPSAAPWREKPPSQLTLAQGGAGTPPWPNSPCSRNLLQAPGPS